MSGLDPDALNGVGVRLSPGVPIFMWPINSAAEFLFYTEGVEGSSPSSVTNFIASWQNGDAADF